MLEPVGKGGEPRLLVLLESNIRNKYDAKFEFGPEARKEIAGALKGLKFEANGFFERARICDGYGAAACLRGSTVHGPREFYLLPLVKDAITHEIMHGAFGGISPDSLDEGFIDLLAQTALGRSKYDPRDFIIGYGSERNSKLLAQQYFEERPGEIRAFLEWYRKKGSATPAESLDISTRLNNFLVGASKRKLALERFFGSLDDDFLSIVNNYAMEHPMSGVSRKYGEVMSEIFSGYVKTPNGREPDLFELISAAKASSKYPYFDAGLAKKLDLLAEFVKGLHRPSDEERACLEFIRAYQRAVAGPVRPKRNRELF